MLLKDKIVANFSIPKEKEKSATISLEDEIYNSLNAELGYNLIRYLENHKTGDIIPILKPRRKIEEEGIIKFTVTVELYQIY